MIEVYPQTKIYIVCPPNHATGGTELLHQLAFKLRKFNYEAFLYYLPETRLDPVHKNFRHYQIEHVAAIEDYNNNIIIMPEIYIDLFRSKEYKNIRRVIWWLSVDDYVKRIDEIIVRKTNKPFYAIKSLLGRYRFPDLKFFRKSKIHHLVQSQYAFNFLMENNIRVTGYLSDFLNREFFSRQINHQREDYVLYNPLKGYDFTKKLIALEPDLNWIPLEKMTPSQVADLLGKSKVYIDFGHHPGKDRFPREAALMGCCVITGKRGSAKFAEDVFIPEEFKFDEFHTAPQLILDKINLCLNNYASESSKFISYVKKIKTEEECFEKDLLQTFKRAY